MTFNSGDFSKLWHMFFKNFPLKLFFVLMLSVCYTKSITSCRVIFLKFFASILGGYRNFIVCYFHSLLIYLFTPSASLIRIILLGKQSI